MIVSSTVIVIIETFQLSSARMYCILPMTYVYTTFDRTFSAQLYSKMRIKYGECATVIVVE
jgi:hypothetical protein